VPAVEDVPERIVQLLNPRIEALSPDILPGWEGCLSIPELRGIVPRWRSIRWSGLTPDGEPIEAVAEGYAARIVQHELDHLDGILYIDRMTDMRLLAYQEHMEDVERDFL
jgi:peptide deformylase